MDLPDGRHGVTRTKAQRGLFTCDAVFGVAYEHPIEGGGRNGPGVIGIVGDRRLGLGNRRPHCDFLSNRSALDRRRRDIMLIALCFAEPAAIFPEAAGSSI
jgi:hypothetical protein